VAARYALSALFISNVFERIEINYFVFWKFSNELFTRPVLEGIILEYPHRSPLY
jgi:hypothetical protein